MLAPRPAADGHRGALPIVQLAILAAASISCGSPLHAQPYGYGQPGYGQPGYGQPSYGRPYYAPPWYGQQPQSPSQPPQQTSQPPSQDPRFRPVPPTNAQGVPPRYQSPSMQPRMPDQRGMQGPYGYPGYQPPNWGQGYGQQPFAAAPSEPPKLEWRLAERDPYLQQPVVLHLDVVSSDNLSTADLEVGSSGDFLIKTLRGPDTSTRETSGRREIVNSFVLTVTPLRDGDLSLPTIKVTGEQVVGGLTQHYEARTERPIRFQVRPSMTSVRPWLPLRSLSLKSSLDREGTLEPGQPVTLAVEIAGEGASAVQLPSLESQLTGPDFRVYREQTLTDTQLSADERQLLAKRTEYYTLVPQVGGRLSLPEMSIAWWNVDLGVREVTRLPIKTLRVRGGGPFGFSASTLSFSGWAMVWIPLAGVALLVVGYWVGVLFRGRPWQLSRASLGLLLRASAAGLGFVYRKAAPHLAGLGPAVLMDKARQAMLRRMPAGARLRRCIRHANRGSTPAEWRARFEAESRACLPLKGSLTQPALTQRILEHRPQADREPIERLMRQLDAARYGHASIDFGRWKRELMAEVRPGAGMLRGSGSEGRVRWAALPALNPGG